MDLGGYPEARIVEAELIVEAGQVLAAGDAVQVDVDVELSARRIRYLAAGLEGAQAGGRVPRGIGVYADGCHRRGVRVIPSATHKHEGSDGNED
jgi:hypothetical protein